MITRLKSYQNGVHGDFFLSVAALLEQLQQDLHKARLGDHDYMQCVAAVRAANVEVERLTADFEGLREEMKDIALALGRSKTDGESDCDWHDMPGEIEEQRNEFLNLERSYTQRLGEMARLSESVCEWVLGPLLVQPPGGVIVHAEQIMEYVDIVRPPEGQAGCDWVVHVLGPDDVIPCTSQFEALRKANVINREFAEAVAKDPSPNWPHCWAVVKNRAAESV